MKKASLANATRPTNIAPHVIKAHADAEKMSADKARINVEVDGELHRRLKMKALQEGKTIKEIVIALVKAYVK